MCLAPVPEKIGKVLTWSLFGGRLGGVERD